MADEALRRIDRLIGIGLRLALSARSGRVLLARVALAIDLDWIPRPWGDTLAAELEAACRIACEPLEFKQVERALRDAWGARPADELDALDREPIIVTPTAQVHRGVLDGVPVAVKLLRPGLASSVRQDLALLDGLRKPLHAAFPQLDAAAVLAEFRERILEELDLEHEASVQRRFHRELRRSARFVVPAPVMGLCRPEVLVSEWIDGVALGAGDLAPAAAAAASARLLAFVLGSARSGVQTMYAAPHPDDVLVLDGGGRLAIRGFGLTRAVSAERIDAAAAMIDAFTANDPAAFGSALASLGWLPAGGTHGEIALELVRDVLGALGGARAARLDGDAVVEARERLLARSDVLAELVVTGTLPAVDLWPSLAAVQLFATIARVGATGSWRSLVAAAVSEGWDAGI